jgi:transposase-like protein
MGRQRSWHNAEFKLEALRLLETSGKSAAQIERELGQGHADPPSRCLGRTAQQGLRQGVVAVHHSRCTDQAQASRSSCERARFSLTRH